MTSKAKIWTAAIVLVLLHALVVFAGFVAPADPTSQNRDFPFVPPSRLHFVDARGHFHLRPFVYPWISKPQSLYEYEESRDREYPVHFFVKGPEYRIGGVFSSSIHLFGVEAPAQIFLAGSDNYGRDQFSRILYGGRISLARGFAGHRNFPFAGLAARHHFRLLRQLDRRIADAHGRAFSGSALALPVARGARLPAPSHQSRANFLSAGRGHRFHRMGASGAPGARCCAERTDPQIRTRQPGLWGLGRHILRRHLLPHTYGVLLTQAALLVPQYVIAEVTLSFLGLGLSEPMPSWGNLLANLQQYNVLVSYWWMFAPGAGVAGFLSWLPCRGGRNPAAVTIDHGLNNQAV